MLTAHSSRQNVDQPWKTLGMACGTSWGSIPETGAASVERLGTTWACFPDPTDRLGEAWTSAPFPTAFPQTTGAYKLQLGSPNRLYLPDLRRYHRPLSPISGGPYYEG